MFFLIQELPNDKTMKIEDKFPGIGKRYKPRYEIGDLLSDIDAMGQSFLYLIIGFHETVTGESAYKMIILNDDRGARTIIWQAFAADQLLVKEA